MNMSDKEVSDMIATSYMLGYQNGKVVKKNLSGCISHLEMALCDIRSYAAGMNWGGVVRMCDESLEDKE